jgi:hypothetical protein
VGDGGGGRRGVRMNLWYYLASSRTDWHGGGEVRERSRSGVYVQQLLLCKFISFTSFDCHMKTTSLPNLTLNTRRNLITS